MAKKRKAYRLPDNTLEIVEKVRAEHNLGTETAALCYIIDRFDARFDISLSKKVREEIAEDVAKCVVNQIEKRLARIRQASTFAERNSSITLDAVNTLLYETNADVLMAASGVTRHNVVIKAEEKYQERLEHNNQVKESRNR